MAKRFVARLHPTLGPDELLTWLRTLPGFAPEMLRTQSLAVGNLRARLLLVPDNAPATLLRPLTTPNVWPPGVRVRPDRRLKPVGQPGPPLPPNVGERVKASIKRAIASSPPSPEATAIIDTSFVGNHDALGGLTQWLEIRDEGIPVLFPQPPQDLGGDHATAVAGVYARAAASGQLRSFKVQWAWQAARALQFVVDTMPTVRVACLPLSVADEHPDDPVDELSLLESIIDEIADRVVVCVAAGNDGRVIRSPGRAAAVFTVGGFEGIPHQPDGVHLMSSHGDLAWPAVKPNHVCWWGPYDTTRGNGSYQQLHGTSGAAAHFSGLAAQWMRTQAMTIAEIRALLGRSEIYMAINDLETGVLAVPTEQGNGALLDRAVVF
jgi:hypothetical protein